MEAPFIIIRRQVKHARLRVCEDNSVQLIVPQNFDQSLIDSLVQKKAPWIARHKKFFQDRIAACPALAPGEILLFDQVYRYVPDPELRRYVLIDEATKEIRSGRDLMRQAELSRWYRTYSREHLAARVAELSAAHRLPYQRLFIRSQRTKWGACSTKANISLNWRLVLAPKHVADYVMLHELMHTKVLNHSHKFWVLLKGICPRCEESICWLNANPPRD